MPYAKAENFCQKYGYDRLVRLVELCNSGKELRDIANMMFLSSAQVCRLRAELFNQVWIPKRGVLEFIEREIEFHKNEIERRQEFINEQNKKSANLQIIMGAVNGQRSSRG